MSEPRYAAVNTPSEQGSRPPSKRQKISSTNDHYDSSSAEIIVENTNDSSPQVSNPIVIKLAGTRNGRKVVAVTGDDKCIRTFDLSDSGILEQRSERIMPKRPCSITFTTDNSTILCADKFGDVYSLPLMGKTYEISAGKAKGNDGNSNEENGEAPKPFVPSATSLTVHTKRNRDALRQQQSLIKKKAKQTTLNFEHQLLLGHVSLLTEVACASLKSSSGNNRDYILTSDRDEHIRVSRGIPQAHIIEGYCLGHTQFVSKLCLVPSETRLLISGGGDNYLLLWDWPSYSAKQKIDLKGPVEAFKKRYYPLSSRPITPNMDREPNTSGTQTIDHLAVSNMKTIESRKEGSDATHVHVIVTVEGLPALFVFEINESGLIKYLDACCVEGNVIDFVVLPGSGTLVYSMDNIYETSSTMTMVSNAQQAQRPSMGAVRHTKESQKFEQDPSLYGHLISAIEESIEDHPVAEQKDVAKGKSWRELLYGLESLRKRGPED